MLESFKAARVRRNSGSRTWSEHLRLQAELGRFASDVGVDRFDPAPTTGGPDERTKELRQLLALQLVTY